MSIDIDAFTELIERGIPFNEYLGVRVREIVPGRCLLSIPYRAELLGDTRRGAVHGGVISMLVDTCGGFAVWSMCDVRDRIATIDLRVDYLKPALSGDLIAESEVKLLGNRVGNAHTVLYSEDDPGTILAEGRSVYNVRRV